MEQPLVAAREIRSGKRAGTYNGGLDITIAERGTQLCLALDHALTPKKTLLNRGIGVLREPCAPIMHLIEDTSFASGDSFKSQDASIW
jgi:hypothetical protein